MATSFFVKFSPTSAAEAGGLRPGAVTGGHGALPHTMTDPVVAAAALITSLQQVVSRNNNATIPTVLSIGRVIANGATNVIPPVVQVAGTLRTMDERWRAQAKRRIHEIAAGAYFPETV